MALPVGEPNATAREPQERPVPSSNVGSTEPKRMEHEELVDASEMLARAFADDPVWRYLTPDERRWPTRMAPAFRHLIAASVGHGTAWTATGAGGTEGIAAWAPPGRWRFPASAAVRSAPAMVRAFGPAGLLRSTRFLGRVEAAHPSEPHWYLEFLATDAHLRGRGIGSTLIGPGLDRADADGLPAYLESSKFDNVAFYARHGFEVVEELVALEGAPPMWRMWREPR